jgi:hypothetical protein
VIAGGHRPRLKKEEKLADKGEREREREKSRCKMRSRMM